MQIEKSYGILKRDRLKSVGAEEREDRTMKIMAVDFGDSRTGIAICDRGELLASPVCVIEEKHFPTTVKKTAEQAQEQGAQKIVVGHPLNMDGSKGPRAQLCEEFAEQLRELVEEKENAEKMLEEKMDRWEYLEELAAKIAGQQS